ncbi:MULTISPECIES: sensor histidine kinase [Helcococcus]|uniref:histidine kinase n=2 Tax=Helcococcus bovis TaxID=3153252 RepID=A0ABW9F4F2_9FIRM
MKKLIDNFLILSSIIFILFTFQIFTLDNKFMILLLISLSLNFFIMLLNYKMAKIIVFAIFLIYSTYNINALYFTPILVFNLFEEFNNKLLLLISLPICFFDFKIYAVIGFSYYLFIQNINLEKIYSKYMKTRDEYAEQNIILRNEKLNLLKKSERDKQLSIFHERERIAKTLHESIGHTVSASIIQIEAIKVISTDENVTKQLNSLQNNLKTGMNEIREALHNLKNQSIDLEKKVLELLENSRFENNKINILNCENLNMNLKFDIISIVKESITNALKYSNADFMSISIINNQKYISINISDNGINFVDISQIKKGIGLISIKEIVDFYNGNLNISYNNGFNIHIILMENIHD